MAMRVDLPPLNVETIHYLYRSNMFDITFDDTHGQVLSSFLSRSFDISRLQSWYSTFGTLDLYTRLS